jgi:F-type H+-transporting ATPase subunit delta
MSLQKIASRYAKSLLDLSKQENSIDSVYQDVLSFGAACRQKDFLAMLKSPMIHTDKKQKVIQLLFDGKIQDLTFKFINLLITKGREYYLPQICTEFISQFRTLNKIRPAVLITAEVMDENQVNEIKQKFSGWLNPGEVMEISQKMDPKIIGGFILEMGGQQIDASAKRKLDLMKTNLYDTSYINLVISK